MVQHGTYDSGKRPHSFCLITELDIVQKLAAKMQAVKLQGAVVCSTPGAVKSVFLKYIDLLQSVECANPLLRCPLAEIGQQAEKACAWTSMLPPHQCHGTPRPWAGPGLTLGWPRP